MPSDLGPRLIIGPLLAACAFILFGIDIAFGMLWGTVTLGVIAISLGGRELVHLLRPIAPGIQPLPIVLGSFVLLYISYPGPQALAVNPQMPLLAIALGLIFVWICVAQMARHGLDDWLSNVALTCFGVLYIGLSFHCMLTLAQFPGEDSRGVKLI